MKLPISNTRQGSTLIEVLVVITLIGLFVIPFLLILARLNRNFSQIGIRAQGAYYSQRNLEVLTNISQKNWNIIKPQYDFSDPSADNFNVFPYQQDFHVTKSSGHWELATGTQQVGPYTTSLRFEPICRGSDFNIKSCSEAGVSLDPNSLRAISSTNWTYDNKNETQTLETIYTNLYTNQP